jgi:hypothetical protein
MKINRPAIRLLIATTVTTVFVSSANAGWNEFWDKVKLGHKRNNAWPDPFTEMDARQTAAPFEVQKHNGWRLHNTISHELFREGDGVLLASGNERVRWIATQAPDARRSIYVLRGRTPEETQARVASVQETLASVQTVGAAPEVYVTDVSPGTASGAWANKINRDWLSNMPAPQLPSESASGTAGAATASQ